MFQAYRKKQTTTNFREQMNKPATGKNQGVFKQGYEIYEILKRAVRQKRNYG